MMFLIINITLIFSLNHLEKHRMKCFKKSSKISKNKCIPPVYHVYVTTSKQRKLSSIYEYSDNSHVFQYIKKSPGNSIFPGLLNIIFILEIHD